MARNIAAYGESISVGDYDPLLGTTGSFHGWCRFTSAASNVIVSKWGSGQLSWVFFIDSGNHLQLVPPSNNAVTGSTVLSTNTWYSLGGRFTGTNKQVLVNGVQDATAACSETMANVTASFRVGSDDFGAAFFHGRLCEVAVWDVSLTDAEFLAMAKGVNPLNFRRSNIKYYAPLYGVASPEPDLSGNGKTSACTAAAADHAPVGRLVPSAG